MFPICRSLLLGVTVSSLLMVNVTSSRVKRADDPNPLQAVVDQLSQQVGTLTAEVAALKTQSARTDTTVAFHAWNSANPLTTVAQGTLILNYALTNIGNAYDTMTGLFTAPVAGLYDFQASIMDRDLNNTEYAHAGLYVDDLMVAIALSDPRHGYYSQVSMNAIVDLSAGQRVYLKNIDNEVNNYFVNRGSPYTMFSGYLIRAD